MEMMRNEQVLGFLLKTKSTELLYVLNVGCERKRGIMDNTKILAWAVAERVSIYWNEKGIAFWCVRDGSGGDCLMSERSGAYGILLLRHLIQVGLLKSHWIYESEVQERRPFWRYKSESLLYVFQTLKWNEIIKSASIDRKEVQGLSLGDSSHSRSGR